MIIDTHGHLIPPDLLNTIRKEGPKLPSLKIIDNEHGLALGFGNAKPSRPAMKGLSDVTGRLAWMQKQGIDKQVNGGWPDWFGSDLPAAEGETWCRMFNDALLSASKAEPKFVPLATLPLQDGARAASVLKAAMAAGFRGTMISTLPRGIGSVLDAPDLEPFWKVADDTGAVIHIHPAFDAGESRVHDYGLANGVGRVADAVVAISRLAMSGHVTRYKNAKIFVPIAAGGLPIVVGRLKRNHSITPGTHDPMEALNRLYTDTIEHDPRVLRFVIEMMGADRVMLGSDMPFPIGDHEPMDIVNKAGLKPDQVAAISGGTAAKLFRIN
ncbi:amidohydrolase family protein [Rhodoplanes sp. Z2-YC6860]|uniref:amidohydrolase family protein n=1 Tax=Rhodoplanes sp. Z2-YC6860 TaxID=674703 RepID=UPI00082E17E6|nr:amidohydrolase family protein [Rhodoplanes sp. Z2-YC6860]